MEAIGDLLASDMDEETFRKRIAGKMARIRTRTMEGRPLLRIKAIFGKDAVKHYDETGRGPSGNRLTNTGGVDEKVFCSREEYEAYVKGVNDTEDWHEHCLLKPKIR